MIFSHGVKFGKPNRNRKHQIDQALFSYTPRYCLKTFVLGFFLIGIFISSNVEAEKCTTCHKEQFQFSTFHSPTSVSCEMCHGGNPEALHKEVAHVGLEAYPGRMKTVDKSCGQSQCHSDLIPMVQNSIMNTLDGMISVTREIYEDEQLPHNNLPVFERLVNHGSDQYLRKLCISCHLGSERKNHQQSFKDRGGGCAACHLKTYPRRELVSSIFEDPDVTGDGVTHPSLTIQIPNDRCFGCHARSGRLSMNYIGFAEVDEIDESRIKDFFRLYDKRLVEKKKADVHSIAGLACIDCHTANGTMGTGERVKYLRDQNDIECQDCHGQNTKTVDLNSLSPRERKYFSLYIGKSNIKPSEKIIQTERKKSPLLHIYESGDDRVMISKVTGKEHPIPLTSDKYYHNISGHERLSCDSCHTAWAPQCYGCHVEFKPDEEQFDYTERKKTRGRWVETRWHVKSELPALGLVKGETITTFVPGMNLIVKKTPQSKEWSKNIFSATSAHTTQKESRTCESCHNSDEALGIITAWTKHSEETGWQTPFGWIDENQKIPGRGTKPGDRSFNQKEIASIRKAGKCLECHKGEDKIYQNYQVALKNLTPECKVE